MFGCFLRNVVISLYISAPVSETTIKYSQYRRTGFIVLMIKHIISYFSIKWFISFLNELAHVVIDIKLPVCTLSPVCSSDISTDFPFSRLTLALEGKHPKPRVLCFNIVFH